MARGRVVPHSCSTFDCLQQPDVQGCCNKLNTRVGVRVVEVRVVAMAVARVVTGAEKAAVTKAAVKEVAATVGGAGARATEAAAVAM